MAPSRPTPIALALHGVLLALACTAFSAAAQTAPAADAASVQAYRIPAGALDQALTGFAAQAGISLTMPPALVQGKTSAGLQGSFAVLEGLARLLAGSGLEAVGGQGGAFALRPAASSPGAALALPAVTVTARAERSAATEGTGSYTTHAVTLGKGAQSLKDIPQSVSVVTRQRMDEQNITSVYDALANTTGITLAQSPQGGQYIYSRGFDLTTVQYDGVPVNRGIYGRASNYSANMAVIDRVEVLRGAAGLLQGEGSPGGAVNLVRKRPLNRNATTVEARAGSWDNYGVQLDTSRVLNEEGTLRGRALVDYEDQHAFIDYVDRRNATFYGTLEYDLSPATRINIGASSEESKGRPFMNGLPSYTSGADLELPRSTYLGATWNRKASSNRGLYFDVSHQLNDDWKLHVSGLYMAEQHDMKYAGVNRAVNPTLMQSANIVARSIADLETTGIDANVTGTFDALGRRHALVGGVNTTRTTNDTTYGFKTNYNIFGLGSYDPAIREPEDAEIYSGTREERKGNARQLGVYSALRLQVSDPLMVVVGARVSWFRTDWDTVTTGTSPSTSSTRSRENAKFNPYAGLVYTLSPQWSAYLSYTDIFKPQAEQNAAGELLQPMVGSNYEAGIKGALLDGQVNTAFAVFRIDQKHRAQEDYSSGESCRDDYYCYTDTGEVRSQGFDAEVSGEVARRWNVFSGYTFNQTKYTKDVASEGLAFNSYTPKHLFRLWSTYQLPGALHAFTVGGGVNAQSASYRTVGTVRANNGGRAVWSALLKYQIDRHWTTALNVNNLFDKRYYSSVTALVNGSYYGAPRSAMLTARYQF
nr:TonB-dependent siderophore receptor [uncultured Albidiferax sp.]